MRFQKKKNKFNVQPILNFKFQTQLVKKKKSSNTTNYFANF